MRRLAFAAFVILFATRGHAENVGVALSVVRDSESGSCPDAAHIFETTLSLFPQGPVRPVSSTEPASLTLDVQVLRTPDGHEASLTVRGERWHERRIVDHDPQCRGLAEALAVAIVMMIDRDAQPLAPPSRSQATLARPQPTTTKEPLSVGLEAGAAGTLGWLGRPAAGAFIGLAVSERRGFGLRLMALRMLAAKSEVEPGPGEVHVDLWATLFGPCWRFAFSEGWSLNPCLELGWGRQRGAASGLRAGNESKTRLWLVLGPSLTAARPLFGPLQATLSGHFTARLHEQVFSVDGQPAQRQEALGAAISLGLLGIVR